MEGRVMHALGLHDKKNDEDAKRSEETNARNFKELREEIREQSRRMDGLVSAVAGKNNAPTHPPK